MPAYNYSSNQGSAAGAIPVYVASPASVGSGITPKAATASTIVTGGTAIVVVTGPVNGGYVTNPPNLASQGIATAENAYVNPVATPGSTDATANGTTTLLTPGSTYTIPSLATGVTLQANAATSGHKLNVVVW